MIEHICDVTDHVIVIDVQYVILKMNLTFD